MLIQFRKAIFKLFKKIIPINYIKTAIEQEQIIFNKENCLYGIGTVFTSTSKIYNFQGISENITIGKNCFINGELKINKYGGKITIGDETYIGENSKIWSGELIIIGNRVQISHGVNIIDNNTHSFNSNDRHLEYKEVRDLGYINEKRNIESKNIIIEDDVWISYNCAILKGIKIGKGAIIAAQSVVTKDVEPYTLVAGIPAKKIRSIS